jgi:hypothetical protein
MSNNNNTIEVEFKVERETKGTFLYAEVDAHGLKKEMKDSTVGAMYVRKSALNGTSPKRLKVTIEPLD